MRRHSTSAFSAALVLLLTGCGGGAGGGGNRALPVPGYAGAPAPSSAVNYAPQATVYIEDYQKYWTCSAFPCSPAAATSPFGQLAVSPAGTTFYFDDNNYGIVELKSGSWSAFVTRSYSHNGQSLTSSNLWAYDFSGMLYTLAATGGQPPYSQYLVSRADQTSGNVFTPNVNDGFDLEASSIQGRVTSAWGGGVDVADHSNGPSPTVHTIVLPGGNCAFRIAEGPNNEIDVSTCGNFNRIYRYSSSFALLSSAIVPNVSHINEIAADPSGSVWFVDDVQSIFGKMNTAGHVTEYPVPAGFRVSAIAEASDGSMWLSLAKGSIGYIGRVSDSGTVTAYSLPAGLYLAEYLRGTVVAAGCVPERLYFLDQSGSIGVIDLNPVL